MVRADRTAPDGTKSRRGKQNYHCQECDRQFINEYTKTGYSSSVKENCLKMYINELGFRAQGVCAQVALSEALCERVTGVDHNNLHECAA